MKKRIIAYLIT